MVVVVAMLHLIALNLLYPKIVGSRVHLNPLVVTFSLMIFGFLWDAPGLLLAIPLTAALKAVCDNVKGLRPIREVPGRLRRAESASRFSNGRRRPRASAGIRGSADGQAKSGRIVARSGKTRENCELDGALCFKPEGRKIIAHGVSRRERNARLS